MVHATQVAGWARRAGACALHLAHGGLLAAGIVGVLVFAAGRLETAPVGFEDAALGSAHAASLPQAPVAAPEPAPVEVVDEPSLSKEMLRVRDWIARRYNVSTVALEPVLAAAETAGRGVGIDPLLIVAVMAVESRFNPFAESQMGAQGLMQVIPRFHMDKLAADEGGDALFDPEVNVRVGTQVLYEGLRRYGSMQAALQYYGGNLSDPEAAYARKVMAIKQRLVTAAGRRQLAGV